MNLDKQTTDRVVWLADFNVEFSREGAGVVNFRNVSEIKPGELTLGDKLVLASGIEYNPRTGDILIRQYDGKTGGNAVTASFSEIFQGAESFRTDETVMLSVTFEDGSMRFVEKHEKVIKYSDMFSDSGELLPEFVEKVKAKFEEALGKVITAEEEKRVKLLGIEKGTYSTVSDNQLEHIALDYRQKEALIDKLKELAYGVPLPKAPDLEKDLGLKPNESPTLWDSILPLGVDPLTGLTSFFHVKETRYDGDTLTGVVVELCRISTKRIRQENIMVYEIEEGDEVVLTTEMLRKQYSGKRYRFTALHSSINHIRNERATELLRSATTVYVEALCMRLGKSQVN